MGHDPGARPRVRRCPRRAAPTIAATSDDQQATRSDEALSRAATRRATTHAVSATTPRIEQPQHRRPDLTAGEPQRSPDDGCRERQRQQQHDDQERPVPVRIGHIRGADGERAQHRREAHHARQCDDTTQAGAQQHEQHEAADGIRRDPLRREGKPQQHARRSATPAGPATIFASCPARRARTASPP